MTSIPRRASGGNKGTMYPEEVRDLLNRILEQQNELIKNQQRQEIAITLLQASVPTRAEIQTLLDQRVSQGVYRVEYDALKEDITALKKENETLKTRMDEAPRTNWSRAAIILTAIGIIVSLVFSLINLLAGR